MHAAAVLFSLFVVTAQNQSATTRPASSGRQPVVVAASVPTLAAPQPAPVETTPEAQLSRGRVASPAITNAPAVTPRLADEPRDETQLRGMAGNSGFSPAAKIVMQFRVQDHTASPTATSAELDYAASVGQVQQETAVEDAATDNYESDFVSPPLPDASPVVVAAEPASPVDTPVTSDQGEISGAEERNSFFHELRQGMQAGLNKVIPASHNRTRVDNLFGPAGNSVAATSPAPVKVEKQSQPVRSTTKVATSKMAPTAKVVAAEPSRNVVRPANKNKTAATKQPIAGPTKHQHHHHHAHADHLAAAPRKLPEATKAAATSRVVQNPDRPEPAPVLPPTLSNPSVSNPALSNGPLTGPGPFDYLYTGQEMPPWVRPYDEDPNLRNFWYHTEPRLKHGKVPHCCSTCNLLPHIEYFPEAHANYYFRPYTFTRLLQQQDQAARMGINPALPYSNELYEKVYAEFDARKRTETVEPGEMPGEMQEFETDTEAPAPPSSRR